MKIEDIAFRAYDIKEKKWLCGFPEFGGFHLVGEFILFGQWDNVINPYLFFKDGKTLDDVVVTQFTGFRDKNNKEIFEKDIVEFTQYDGVTHKMTVVTSEGSLMLGSVKSAMIITLNTYTASQSKIIGNVFDGENKNDT